MKGKHVQQLSKFSTTSRRRFLTTAGTAVAAVAAAGALGGGTADAALPVAFGAKGHRRAVTDNDIAIFALNAEYLGSSFSRVCAYGATLPDADITGIGSRGSATKPNPATPGAVVGGSQVPFTDPTVRAVATAIANDEFGHLQLLRTVLGKHVTARPALDLVNSFQTFALNAGVISAGETFSPYTGDDNYLLAVFMLEGTEVTAYHGASPYIRSPATLSTAAGILATEAYHESAARTLLFQRAQSNPALLVSANKISAYRAKLDASGGDGNDTPLTDAAGTFMIGSVDADGVAHARTFDQILNIVYGGSAATPGGFFPAGFNGLIA